jgi:hypothetical protein
MMGLSDMSRLDAPFIDMTFIGAIEWASEGS